MKSLPLKAKILDVGCGLNSPERFKSIRPDLYYVGVDVCDCDEATKKFADEYVVTDGEKFAGTIRNLPGEFDAAVSSHNLEHCNHPMETLDAICSRLKKGGRLHLSFPSENSVTFPSRIGTLNFYDGETHIYVPDFKAVMKRLIRDNKMFVEFAAPSYRPFFGRMAGMLQNLFMREKTTRLIWYYYVLLRL